MKNRELTEEELKMAAGGLTTYSGTPHVDPSQIGQGGGGFQTGADASELGPREDEPEELPLRQADAQQL